MLHANDVRSRLLLDKTFTILNQADSDWLSGEQDIRGLAINQVVSVKDAPQDSAREMLMDSLHKCLSGKKSITVTGWIRDAHNAESSTYHNVNVELIPFKNADDSVSQILVQVTSSEESQKALQLTQHQIDTFERVSESGSWELNLETNQLSWSDGVFVLCEYEPQEFKVTFETGLNAIHPDDREYATSALQETLETGKDYYIRKRLLTKNGGVKHVISRADVVKNKDGKPIKLVGVFINRTKEQEYFEELLLQQTKEDALMNSTDDLIWSVDVSFHIISCNNAFREMIEQITGTKLNQGNYALSKVFGHEELAKWRGYYERALNGEKFSVKEDVFDTNGELLNSRIISITPLLDQANIIWGVACFGKEITSETKANKALEESEKRFRSLVENSSGAIGILTPEGDALFASSSIEYVIGYTEKESLSLNIFDLIHPEDKERVAAKLAESVNHPGVPIQNPVCRVKHKNGEWRWVAATFTNLTHEPFVKGIVNNFRDVTASVNDELQLKLLIDNTEEGFILMDRNLTVVSFNRQFETLYRKFFNITVQRGENILDYAQPERKGYLKQLYERVLAGAHEVSEIEVPDSEGGTHIFSISYKPAVNRAGEVEGAFVSTLDITENKRNEQQSKEYQFFIETAIENLPIGIAVNRTEDNTAILMNKTFADIYGWPKEELTDVNSFFEKVYPDEEYRKVISKRVIDDVMSGDPKRMNWEGITITTQKGEQRIINAKNIPVVDQNLMISTVVDVTERETNLQRIKDSERQLLAAQRLVKLGNWQLNLSTREFEWSDEVFNIWGRTREQFKPTLDTFLETMHADDRPLFENDKEAVRNGYKQLDFEHRILLPDGTLKWVHEKATLVKDASGNPTLLEGTVQDITVEKMLSLSLEESNQRYHYATQATFDAIWDWDIIKNTIYRGENYQFLFGYSREDLIASSNSWANHIHPEDRDTIIQSIHEAIQGNQSKWTGEYRYEQQDGSYAFVNDRGIIVRNRNGKAIRMVGAMQDITKQKAEEARLKLLESVITNTNDAVLITDAEPLNHPGPKIIYVNEAFTRMTGYTPEEVIGKSPRILQGPASDKEELRKLGDALRNWQPCEITIINYKKSGEPFWINFTVTPVADETGWFTHWIAVERDVTKIKQAEQELQNAYDDKVKYIQNIEEKNKRLSEIAWIQSHIVRAPVARIMGIVEALTDYDVDSLESKQLLNHLIRSAEDLDRIIREIADKTAETDI